MSPLLVIRKIDRQGIYLEHKISLHRIEADLRYRYGIYCTYKTQKLSGLLWAQYLDCGYRRAQRIAYLLADHLDFAPLWTKYRSTTIEPISMYWQIQTEKIEFRLDQLQSSDIISRDPTDEPSGLDR